MKNNLSSRRIETNQPVAAVNVDNYQILDEKYDLYTEAAIQGV